jgi:putative hemolysin
MSSLGLELVVLLFLVLANGLFAMSENALVAARKSRLEDWAEKGNAKAKVLLELADNPTQFFSTVQIGMTLTGILTGVFIGRILANRLSAILDEVAGLQPYSDAIAVAAVVVCVTFFSVVVGELVPKRIALGHAERVATFMAVPMRMISRLSSPVVWLSSAATDLIFRVMGSRPVQQPPVTEEEIKGLIQQGTAAGVFDATEQDMIEAVISLGDKSARALMTPRNQIVWLDITDPAEEIRRKVAESGHSRFPVCNGSLDDVVGITQTKDLLSHAFTGKPIDLRTSSQAPVFAPRSMTALQILEHIKSSGSHLVLVIDEYGGIEGLLTHHDLLEAIAGDIPFDERRPDRKAVQRPDGSWLLDGMLAIQEFKEIFALDDLPGEKKDAYQTLGGFVFTRMGRVPTTGEYFDWNRLRFEIADMDGKRIDKVLVSPIPQNTSRSV